MPVGTGAGLSGHVWQTRAPGAGYFGKGVTIGPRTVSSTPEAWAASYGLTIEQSNPGFAKMAKKKKKQAAALSAEQAAFAQWVTVGGPQPGPVYTATAVQTPPAAVANPMLPRTNGSLGPPIGVNPWPAVRPGAPVVGEPGVVEPMMNVPFALTSPWHIAPIHPHHWGHQHHEHHHHHHEDDDE